MLSTEQILGHASAATKIMRIEKIPSINIPLLIEAIMEESTLKLAQNLVRECSLEEAEEEARDGSPKPLRKNPARKLEEKLKGFR
jgi:hypothetical protein